MIDTIKTNKPCLDSLLHTTSVILFRVFPINTTLDSNDIIEAFKFEELPYISGLPLRPTLLDGSSQPMSPHLTSRAPSNLRWHRYGEKHLVLSHIIYERMKEKCPYFIQWLEEHVLIYTRLLGEDDDPLSPIGCRWKLIFLLKTRRWPKKAAKLGMKLGWLEDEVKTIMSSIPTVKYDKSRNHKIWFNSMVVVYTG
ncbi:hypothetical protein P3X46_028159 [Hevea brasiliensis]|uniref:Uncharacterized protein n=1 Tax=Hevea brasiliensis TaxID=3981 RepID=A0ABQ9KN50_HEVBR|nr:hypothetical protein P3X46_028159 [Hevea brasiliensis]